MSAFFNSGDLGIFAQKWPQTDGRNLVARGKLRAFAVAKTLPLDHTINIVSCSLKRAFATCQKEEVNTLKVRRQHVEELHPTLRPEAQGE